MKSFFVILLSALGCLQVLARNGYDLDMPFGYCTLSHCTDATKTFGKHYEHKLHILHPISSKYPTIFATSTTFRYFNC